MIGRINRELIPDPRISLFDKHLPQTPQVQRLLRKQEKAHVFNHRATMDLVIQAGSIPFLEIYSYGLSHFGSKSLVITNKLSAKMREPLQNRDAPVDTFLTTGLS
ncbi:DUF6972 family protein [Microcoleus sp. herbarium12]|uniref:DUF6972 family protein n=1 Tax=Microcoleus sp. herbarium12 TaxID=3055437 RepID=UPI003FA5F7AB